MKPRTCAPPRTTRRFRSLLLAAGVCMLVWCPLSPTRADQSYVTATFDDKTVDQPIGTGGPALGEPTWVDAEIEAIVRATPFETLCLEVRNLTGGGNLGFELGGPISEGIVAIIIDLWFYEGTVCNYWLDSYNSSWQQLTKISFNSDGTFYIVDPAGRATEDMPCPTGRALPVLMVFNLDAGTYSVWVDEVQQVNDRPLSVTIYDFQRIMVAAGWDCPEGNRFSMDQIRIIDREPQVPVETPTWGSLRALFR